MEQNYCYQCCLYDICKHIDRGTHTLASPACDAFDPGMRWEEMSDNGIINALECQLGIDDSCNCYGCLFREDKSCIDASERILEVVKDLINHQKAEIELLKLENKKLHETNNALNYQVYVWKPNEVLNKFLERLGIDDQPTVSRWIPVTERLPEPPADEKEE